MKTYMIHAKIVRSFSIGFTIYSPKLNGFAMSIDIACFSLMISNRCSHLLGSTHIFGFTNYWNG